MWKTEKRYLARKRLKKPWSSWYAWQLLIVITIHCNIVAKKVFIFPNRVESKPSYFSRWIAPDRGNRTKSSSFKTFFEYCIQQLVLLLSFSCDSVLYLLCFTKKSPFCEEKILQFNQDTKTKKVSRNITRSLQANDNCWTN